MIKIKEELIYYSPLRDQIKQNDTTRTCSKDSINEQKKSGVIMPSGWD